MKNNELETAIHATVERVADIIMFDMTRNAQLFADAKFAPPQIISTIIAAVSYVLLKVDPFLTQESLEDWILKTSRSILSYQIVAEGGELPEGIKEIG